MEVYEFEGKTTEEAIENASRELNVAPEELDIDVIEPGSAGIFGLVGSRKARIRITYGAPEAEFEEADAQETPEEADDQVAAQEEGRAQGQEITEAAEDPGAGEEGLEMAKETLEKILALIPVETDVSAVKSDGRITLTIEGDKSGLLIGRKGKTLDALQFIVNKIVNKNLEEKTRVVIDSENYRQRREESLVQLARKMGEKVKRTGKAITIGPLNPQERRVVHLALKDDDGLDTRSRGEGLIKRLVIVPKA